MGAALPSTILFVMLNPSTADDEQDDPTIRRCIGFAKRGGFARLEVVNLFTVRATDPKELLSLPVYDLNLPDADDIIRDAASRASLVVCAWGAARRWSMRACEVTKILREGGRNLFCLGKTSDGLFPRHPLYMPSVAVLEHFP